MAEEYIENRAKRGSKKRFKKVLRKVANIEAKINNKRCFRVELNPHIFAVVSSIKLLKLTTVGKPFA